MTYRTNTRDDTKGQRRHQLRGCTWVALPVLITIYQYLKTSGKMHLFTQALYDNKTISPHPPPSAGSEADRVHRAETLESFRVFFPHFPPSELAGGQFFSLFLGKRGNLRLRCS